VQDEPVLLQHRLTGVITAQAEWKSDRDGFGLPKLRFLFCSDDGSDSCLRQMPDHQGIVIWGQMIAGFSLRKECDDAGSFVTGFLLLT
jgi:hypothetical protein